MSEPSTLPARDSTTRGVYTRQSSGSASSDNSQRRINSSISRFSKPSTCDQRWCLSFGFSFSSSFFFKRTSVTLLKLWAVEDYSNLGTPCPRARGILSSLRTLTNEAERTLDLSKRRSRHGTSPWLSTEQLWVRSKRKRRGPV